MDNSGRALGKRESLTCKAGVILSLKESGATLFVNVLLEEGRGRKVVRLRSSSNNLKLFESKRGKHYFQIDENNEIIEIL